MHNDGLVAGPLAANLGKGMAILRRFKDGRLAEPRSRERGARACGFQPAAWAASAYLSIAAAGPAVAQDVPQVAIAEFGEYAVLREEVVTDARSGSSGVTERVSSEGARLLRRTDRIEAVPCRRFGVWFRLHPPGRAEVLPVTQRLTHPLMTRPDGRTGTVEADEGLLDDTPRLSGFSFTYGWEMVPGIWTFAVLSGDKVLGEKSFEVVVPLGGIVPPTGGCDRPVS